MVKAKFLPCGFCTSKKQLNPIKAGYYYDLVDGYEIVVECDCHKLWIQDNLKLVKAKKSGVILNDTPDTKEIGAMFPSDSLDFKKVKYFIDKFELPSIRQSSLYIQLVGGDQSSKIANWIGKSLVLKDHSIVILTFAKFFQEAVSNSFDLSEKERVKAFSDKLLQADCVIFLEAFRKAQSTNYANLSYLESFLKERMYLSHKSTLFVTDVAMKDITTIGYPKSLSDFIDREIQEQKTNLILTLPKYITRAESIFDDII